MDVSGTFFCPASRASYDERRVQKLDIMERAPKDAVEILRKYLEISRVRSGAAIESARADYQNISRRKNAANKIPAAWQELVSEPDDMLMDVVAEKTETICGYRPAPEDVEAFLVGLSKVSAAAPSEAKPPASARSIPTVSERGVEYRVFGQSRKAENAIEALIDILRTLAS